MIQSFKYTFKSLKNTKGFLTSMLVMPILMVILLSLTLSYSQTPLVGVVKGPYVGDFSLENLRVQDLEDREADYFLASAQASLVVYLDSSGQVEKYYSSVANNPLIQIVKQGLNQGGKGLAEKPSISYSLGVIIFKLITAGGLLASLIIQEKNTGVFVRLRNSRTGFTRYILGKLVSIYLVYNLANLIIIGFYYLLGFDFGRSNPLEVFAVFNLAIVFSLAIYTCLGGLARNEGYVWLVSTGLFFPLALVSGVLFPVEFMPDWMRTLALISPQYHLNLILLQDGLSPLPVASILILSLALFGLGLGLVQRRA